MLRRLRRRKQDATDPDLVHVVFDLEVDDDGWPPVSGERVWAAPLGSDRFRLENAPWFVRGVAEGDVVRAIASRGDQWPRFVEVVEWSGNCTIRVIPFAAGELAGDQERVLALFTPLGVTGEGAGIYPIVALTIGPDLDLRAIKTLLRQGSTEGWWEYEEGCVGEEWLGL